MRTVNRVLKKQEAEEQKNNERWVLEQWTAANATFHALRYGDELPPTKREHEERKRAEKNGKDPPINWSEVEQAREQMLDSKNRFLYALQGPQFFASWIGASGVMDEPEEDYETWKSKMAEVDKVSSKANEARAAEERLISMLERYTEDSVN